MKQILYCVAAFCIVSIISCREKPATRPTLTNRPLSLPSGSAVKTPANPILPVTNTNPVSTNNNTGIINPAHGQPGHRCDIAVGAPIPATASPAKTADPVPVIANPTVQTTPATVQNNSTPPVPTVTAGLNPAHGQPGHRCDIAVGAPLNSKPAQKSQPSTSVTAPVVKQPAQQPDASVAKGLNPAHGQPGHRCDIAVGKPLNEAKKN